MTGDSPSCDPAAYEQLIFQVRGIQAARVVTDQHGTIDEVHVVGEANRSAKQIVRDIESILYVRGGIRLDHRKVSLVQLADGAAPGPVSRVVLRQVRAGDPSGTPHVTVTLSHGDRHVSGASGNADPGADSLTLAASATVEALTRLTGSAGQLRLEQVVQQPLGPIRICLSYLSLTTDAGLEPLVGTSVVRDDAPTAAARAVLDAVNRRLQRLLVTAR